MLPTQLEARLLRKGPFMSFTLPALAAAGAILFASAAQPPKIPVGLNGVPSAHKGADSKIAEEFRLNFYVTIMQWKEPEPGRYFWPESAGEDKLLQRLSRLKEKGYTIALTNTTVHMDQKHLPAYLANKPFDDPEFLDRWEKFLTGFLARYGSVVDYFNVGNEIGSYFGGHKDEWQAYVAFVKRAREVVDKSGGKVKLGAVLKDSAIPEYWPDLKPYCDYLGMTYYAPCSAFAKSPTALALDPDHEKYFAKRLERALDLARPKPVLITEIGCATHESLDSSPELQAQFIEKLFAWLDGHEGSILGISWLSHIDWPYKGVKQALEGFLDDKLLAHEPFIRYLSSLGLMYEDGAPKPGYAAFKKSLEQYRGR